MRPNHGVIKTRGAPGASLPTWDINIFPPFLHYSAGLIFLNDPVNILDREPAVDVLVDRDHGGEAARADAAAGLQRKFTVGGAAVLPHVQKLLEPVVDRLGVFDVARRPQAHGNLVFPFRRQGKLGIERGDAIDLLDGNVQAVRDFLNIFIPSVDFWHSYMAYFGSILAVITALYIVKWQDIIDSKKDLAVHWEHVARNADSEIKWAAINKRNDRVFNYLLLSLINTGNRIIIISCVHIVFASKRSVALSTVYFQDQTYLHSDATFPCKLDAEESAILHIPLAWFVKMATQSIKSNYCTSGEKIIVVATDTTGKEYSLTIHKTFGDYLRYYEERLSL